MIIKAKNINHSFFLHNEESKILSDVSFTVNKNEILSIRGGNGAGKTTLFNIISGVLQPTDGILERAKSIEVGTVFQNYTSTLLPWYSIEYNIGIPLKLKGYSNLEVKNRVKEIIDYLGFTDLPLKNRIDKLSGGQKQKVAICRALISHPDLLLLDEPFSNLDTKTSIQLQEIIQKYQEENQLSIIMVSHILDHNIFLADRILKLEGNPSSITKEFEINLERPRKQDLLVSSDFEAIRNRILEYEYSLLRDEN